MIRRLISGLLFTAVLMVAGQPAWAEDPPNDDDVFGNSAEAGTTLGVLSRDQVTALVDRYGREGDHGPWYEIGTASVCGGEPEALGFGNQCNRYNVLCQSGGGDGPPITIWTRRVDREGEPFPNSVWQRHGDTCYPELLPGQQQLTMAMIQEAFHDTDFTVPTVNIQPEGDVTLVNLPTYFEVKFPDAGYGPDEVDTPDPSRLLGYRVEIRPVLQSVTYHLGETTIGPTQSLGGPHPNGDVRATYTRPGTHQIRADIVYTGQFRVGGSGWIDIPGQVDLQGTPVTLTIREARARLYSTP